ncbi:MAG: recombinase family protein, partial [Gammaproteobacteria bacterium]|nr:recombinase family protein [Gammaproteobacteria bacterium]
MIAYVRVSTSRQVEDGNSIASQSEIIRKYAKDRGLR